MTSSRASDRGCMFSVRARQDAIASLTCRKGASGGRRGSGGRTAMGALKMSLRVPRRGRVCTLLMHVGAGAARCPRRACLGA